MSELTECQFNANCGGYCETEREIEFALCEDCLEARDDDEKGREIYERMHAENARLAAENERLLAALDTMQAAAKALRDEWRKDQAEIEALRQLTATQQEPDAYASILVMAHQLAEITLKGDAPDHAERTARSLITSMKKPVDRNRSVSGMVEALEFYANGDHLLLADDSKWDTCSGEPANFLHDDAGTASVEDGSIARAALAAHRANGGE